ncbi:NAD(P)-dependent alcohol dehydrogenase [Rhodococcus artemisiae]|uniref:alcohol dehydrogenase n=1 Tax=Rhodococcus artemisiae TaxID=714159 RepID=A0ABU7L7C5_9NOCA|nr:NAD(P)-dependent alcohol dehydrogenase [Rhodococcus artemisiae]MEE2057433.1 NAD(P)-dependent alcohol dehydrogenase [Rhodococcus artemisiae]
MRALQYTAVGSEPVVVEIPTPAPGPGEILLKVIAAGLCHSDIFVMDQPEDSYGYGLPLTLGHEGVGTVAELGAGVSGISIGDAVAVYGPWGCGTCHACTLGRENYCTRAAELAIAPPGLGAPGSMAEYMIVDSVRHLVPIGDLDPVRAAPLTDAGLTPYHAVQRVLPLLGPGSTAVVVGVGGLGHVAIQILRAITATRIVAVDLDDERLALARSVGADDAVRSDAGAADAVRALTNGLGATVVFDFVGAQSTIDMAQQVVAIDGHISIVGIHAGAHAKVGFFLVPFGASVVTPYWGTRSELMEVVALAHDGKLDIHTETFGLDEGPTAYRRLREGTILGRGVVVPG